MNTKKFLKSLFEFFEIAIIGTILFVFIYFLVGQLIEVSGDSMLPNFRDREQLIAEKISLKIGELKHNEVLIIRHPQNDKVYLIKRLIALPGDKIMLSNGSVYLNGTKLEETFLKPKTQTWGGAFMKDGAEYQLEEGEYVFMGDNREESIDSREWGFESKNLIFGRPFFVFWPTSSIRFIR